MGEGDAVGGGQNVLLQRKLILCRLRNGYRLDRRHHLSEAFLENESHKEHRADDEHAHESTRQRFEQHLLNREAALGAEHLVDQEEHRVTDHQYDRGVGVAQQQRNQVDAQTGGDPDAADPVLAGDRDKVLFQKHMTAQHRRTAYKAQQIGICVESREAVLVYDQLDPVDLKADSRHQKRQSDDADDRGEIHDKAADGIQLSSEVQMLLGMDRIKEEETDGKVELHHHIIKEIVLDMYQRRHGGEQHKQQQPDAVAGFEDRVLSVLVVKQQGDAPQKEKRKHSISRKLHERYITQEQTNHIASAKQRSIPQDSLYLTH